MAKSKLLKKTRRSLFEEQRNMTPQEKAALMRTLKARGLAIDQVRFPNLSTRQLLEKHRNKRAKGRRPSFINNR